MSFKFKGYEVITFVLENAKFKTNVITSKPQNLKLTL